MRHRRRGVLYAIASGKPTFSMSGGFASNGYGEHSPGGYSPSLPLVAEIVLTLMFLVSSWAPPTSAPRPGFAPIAIGLCLTLIHLISIPVTNTSVNPARSTGLPFWPADGPSSSSGSSGSPPSSAERWEALSTT